MRCTDEDHRSVFADRSTRRPFSTTIDNPYLPNDSGNPAPSIEATTPDGLQRTTTEVTRDTKTIMGVDDCGRTTTPSASTARQPEDTFDWYAQDRDGSVWYLRRSHQGDSEDGTADTAGSFEGGVNGALPGIIMPAPSASRRSVPPGVREGCRRGHRRGAQPHRQRNHPTHRAAQRLAGLDELAARSLSRAAARRDPDGSAHEVADGLRMANGSVISRRRTRRFWR